MRVALFASIAAFFVLAFGDVLTSSPTSDELPHLAAGMTYLAAHDFRVNPEHPPLVKLIAASALTGMRVWPPRFRDDGSLAFKRVNRFWPLTKDTVWAQWLFSVAVIYGVRDEFVESPTDIRVPREAFYNDVTAMFRRARIPLLLMTGGGLIAVIFFWSRALWGLGGAVLSVALFCSDPNFIAHCGLVTTDAAVTFFIAASIYFFWRISQRASAVNFGGFALFTALAAVTKFSSILLVVMIGALLVLTHSARALIACVVAFIAAFVVIWGIYGFEFDTTNGPAPIREITENRVLLFVNDHHLLPHSYVYGAARANKSAVRPSYLLGEKRVDGFRTYFFWTFLTKTPIASIAAILAALALAIRRRPPALAFVLLPAAIYFAVACSSPLDIGHRHILPIYPFLYVLCGVLPVGWLTAPALAFVSCLVVFMPFDAMWSHHLSYFNEIARGPRHGWEIISDSNIDWGQDLGRLGGWLEEHHIDEPINLVWGSSADPRYYGIRYLNLHDTYWAVPSVPLEQMRTPGIFAISVSRYSGATAGAVDEWRNFLATHQARLVGRAGYSILIYRVDR